MARFARSHGEAPGGVALEDLLVMTAEAVWKGQRSRDVEHALMAHLEEQSGKPPWLVMMRVDDALTRLAADSDKRLTWQAAASLEVR